MNSQIPYPPMPAGADARIIEPSPGFKIEVMKTMGAIVIFMIVYLLLVASAIGLALLLSYGGIMLMVNYPRFITLMIGVGMIGTGLMVIYFLLKFIFTSNKTDRSGLVEVTRDQQPDLFEFIKKITAETGTPFPKKIYLSQEVNACVFYDSGFWSMFLPVRKNLQIGLGLVNSLDISEFKGVLAHEFGHFSQRSMKLGSYTYNVNKIIYDMLFHNEGYQQTLESWGSISGYFSFFASITVRIVMFIQYVLQKVYAVVNKSYMGLSRQMEFHADTIACYVTGTAPTVHALLKIDATQTCFQTLFASYNKWVSENLKPDNLYPQHTEVMRHYAGLHGVPFQQGLLRNEGEMSEQSGKSRLIIKDQWASHPSTEERVRLLRGLNVKSGLFDAPAWIVFRNPEELQKQMTEKVYASVKFNHAPALIDRNAFVEKYVKEAGENNYDPRFKGFYDARNITSFDVNEVVFPSPGENGIRLEELFTEETGNLPSSIRSLENDLGLLASIESGQEIKSFDFDGVKYRRGDIHMVKEKLTEELTLANNKLMELDKKIFRTIYRRAVEKERAQEVLKELENIQSSAREAEEHVARYREIVMAMQPIYSQQKPDAIKMLISRIKLKEEPFKKTLRQLVDDPIFSSLVSSEQKARLGKYLSEDLIYHIGSDYHQTNVNLLNESLNIFINAVIEKDFKIKKRLLEKQLELFVS